jgi:hypothetical protein
MPALSLKNLPHIALRRLAIFIVFQTGRKSVVSFFFEQDKCQNEERKYSSIKKDGCIASGRERP